MSGANKILEVKGLKKHFPIHSGLFLRKSGDVFAVDGVDFELFENETLGIVGESGCGKSTLGRTLIKIYEPTSGQIIFNGTNLSNLDSKQMFNFKKSVQMIFQDPYSSLNPRMNISRIVGEPLRVHTSMTDAEREKEVEKALQVVGLNSGALNRYPHEFSGGQRQRIAIARAIIMKPKLIIADEPVSALDVSIQSQILNLLKDLQEQLKNAYIFISHNLAVVKHMSDKVAVMYLGKIVELTDKDSLFNKPLHPYTQSLMVANPEVGIKKLKTRAILKGDVPSPINPPSGCHFHTRCPYATDLCKTKVPSLKNISGTSSTHLVSCHYVNNSSDNLLEGRSVC